jgi:hypothetical protein
MKYFKSVMVLLAILFLVNGVSGCKGKSPAEKAGEKMDETQPAEPAEKSGDMIDETMEKVKESGKKLNDGMEKAIEKIDETMEATEDKVNEMAGE